ncbi:MAG TPA: cytochrome P450 [Tepidiformaceae bacterium]|nr:cytochrome P450 [Tepidiformaceae bacterium]
MAFFDPTRAAYRANPYPSLARLRREDPVHWSPAVNAWILTRYDDCALVLRESDCFTTDPSAGVGPRAEIIGRHRASVPLGTAPTLGTSTGEQHRRLRHIVNPLFAPAQVERLRPSIASRVEALLDTIPRDEPFDLIEAFADPLPKQVMLEVMGIPPADAQRVQRWFATIELARTNPTVPPALVAEARSARAASVAFLRTYEEGGLRRDSVLATLLRASGAEAGLSPDEVVSLAVHIGMVGTGPSAGAIANGLAALLEFPGELAMLRNDPAHMPAAVHELFRYDSPTHAVPRIAVEDTILAGRRIRRGDVLLAMVGAANRDPAAFADPDRLDLARDARRHLGFGQGEHLCLGAPLARVIAEEALRSLLQRFDRLEVVGGLEYGPAFELRMPERMIVRAA